MLVEACASFAPLDPSSHLYLKLRLVDLAKEYPSLFSSPIRGGFVMFSVKKPPAGALRSSSISAHEGSMVDYVTLDHNIIIPRSVVPKTVDYDEPSYPPLMLFEY